jgi:16S rRNA (cytosine967-C5)-methyltransferase
VDAPCSGLGTLRRTPELRWRHTPESIKAYPPRQRAILEAWAPRLKPGGRLVYGTCTIHPDENESVVRQFVEAHPEFHVVPVSSALPPSLAGGRLADGQGFLRVWPHRHGTEAFFAAVLERSPKEQTSPAERS